MHKEANTLVILSPAFAVDESDSQFVAQENLIRSLNRNFPLLKIIIIAFHFPVLNGRNEYLWYGNRVITLSGAMKGKVNSLILWAKVWRKLRQLKKHNNLIGLFSFFCSESAFVGQYFAKCYRLKHFIWILGQDAKKENHQVKRIRPKPQDLIVISDFLRNTFKENHGIEPAHFIPAGILPEQFKRQSSVRDIDLLGAGSLIRLKQYDQFIEVVKKVSEQIPGAHAIIAGNGPEYQNLRHQIKTMELQSTLALDGVKQSHLDTLRLMQRSKVFLHTSAYEGLGTVCIEALYAGAHVISFCKPINADIPHWHIVDNISEMAQKAVALLRDSATEYCSVSTFFMDDSARALMKLYAYNAPSI